MPVASSSPSTEPEPLPPTSEELIAAALSAGAIDLETSLRYRALALYGDARLPEVYRSPVIDYEAGARLTADIREQTPNLSPATLADVAPILARPNGAISVFNQPPPTASGVLLASTRSVAARTAAVTWVSAPAAGGDARVWIKDFPGAEASMKTFASDVVSPIWPKLLQFFRAPLPDDGKPGNAVNPDSAIDIYLVDFKDVDPRRAGCETNPTGQYCHLAAGNGGWTPPAAPFFDNKSSAYMLVRADDSPAGERQTIAHELFHAAQDAFDYTEAPDWLGEATATWGSFRITQALGEDPTDAHAFLYSFFDELDQPLTTFHDIHQYGAYLYFYFAQMDHGDDIVFKTWQLAGAPGKQGAQAIDRLLRFRDAFPEFALRTWNQPPVDRRYGGETDPTFPDLHPPVLGGLHEMTAESPPVVLQSLLDPLSIAYFHFTFNDAAIKQVIFNNSLVGQPDAAVQALVFIDGAWQPISDWSARNKVTFCRDQPDQDIHELVLVISNSSLDKVLSAAADPQLEVEPDPCTNWAGTVSMTYTNNMSFPGFVQEIELNLSGHVTWQADPRGLHELEGSTAYLPVDGSITWEEHGRFGTDQLMCTITGSGTYPIRNSEHYRFYSSLEVATDPATSVSRYRAVGLEPPGTQLGDIKISCGAAIPPFPEDLAASWLDTGNSAQPDGGFKQSDANGGLTGTYVSDSSNQGTGIHTWTWDFEPSP